MSKSNGSNHKDDRFLVKSVLLEESSAPFFFKMVIYFSAITVIAFVLWAAFVEVSEVAITTGTIVTMHEVNKIQHPTGGAIEKIFIKDKQYVDKGDLLITLDSTLIKAELKEALNRKETLEKKYELIKSQIQIRKNLMNKGLSSRLSYLSLKTQESDLQLALGQVEKTINVNIKMLEESVIKAPISGYIHDLIHKSVDEVINPGQTIMEIIPKDRKLFAVVRILSKDIGHVKVDAEANVKLVTYDYGRYGGIKGKLFEISPTTFLDEKQDPYYKGSISLEQNHVGKVPGMYPVIPGMTLTAEVKTGSKTILQYLLKPVFSSASKAMIER